jgi:hypothetical protein
MDDSILLVAHQRRAGPADRRTKAARTQSKRLVGDDPCDAMMGFEVCLFPWPLEGLEDRTFESRGLAHHALPRDMNVE